MFPVRGNILKNWWWFGDFTFGIRRLWLRRIARIEYRVFRVDWRLKVYFARRVDETNWVGARINVGIDAGGQTDGVGSDVASDARIIIPEI